MGKRELLDVDSIQALSRSEKEALRFRHLYTEFDFDAPRRRLALVHWVPALGRWCVERGGSSHAWTELHVVGELLFGESPWRAAQVLAVFGRLGSVEAAVAKLPPPGRDFVYCFEFQPDEKGRAGSVRARYVRGLWEAAEAAFYDGGVSG